MKVVMRLTALENLAVEQGQTLDFEIELSPAYPPHNDIHGSICLHPRDDLQPKIPRATFGTLFTPKRSGI